MISSTHFVDLSTLLSSKVCFLKFHSPRHHFSAAHSRPQVITTCTQGSFCQQVLLRPGGWGWHTIRRKTGLDAETKGQVQWKCACRVTMRTHKRACICFPLKFARHRPIIMSMGLPFEDPHHLSSMRGYAGQTTSVRPMFTCVVSNTWRPLDFFKWL